MTDSATIIGAKIGALTVIGFTDATRKRVVAKCVCRRVVQVSVEGLLAGTNTSCGCRPPTRLQSDLARSEGELRQHQREQRRWKPGDRS